MTLNNRIKKIREVLCNGSTKEIASKLNISSQAISNYVRDGYNIGREVIENLLIAFPDVDANWLILGRGEMLLNKNSIDEDSKSVPYFLYKELKDENKELIEEIARLKGLLTKNNIDFAEAM